MSDKEKPTGPFTNDFKMQLLHEYRDGYKTAHQLSQEHGIPQSHIYQWASDLNMQKRKLRGHVECGQKMRLMQRDIQDAHKRIKENEDQLNRHDDYNIDMLQKIRRNEERLEHIDGRYENVDKLLNRVQEMNWNVDDLFNRIKKVYSVILIGSGIWIIIKISYIVSLYLG